MYGNPELLPADDGGVFHLRPLTAGEVFDRTFALFRRFFWMFVGIALLPAAMALGAGISRVLILHFTHRSQYTNMFGSPGLAVSFVIWNLITLGAYGLSQAATTSALSDVYLGRKASIKAAYKVAWRHWFRYPVLILVQMLQAGWLPWLICVLAIGAIAGLGVVHVFPAYAMTAFMFIALLAMFPWGIYRYVKVSLALPASVVEDMKIRAAFKRSKGLVKERKWRIFLLFLMIGVLYMVIGLAMVYAGVLGLRGNMHLVMAQAIQLMVNFLAALLLQPIMAIGICLFYFDERVRQEGFDIEFMMQQTHPQGPLSVEEIAGA